MTQEQAQSHIDRVMGDCTYQSIDPAKGEDLCLFSCGCFVERDHLPDDPDAAAFAFIIASCAKHDEEYQEMTYGHEPSVHDDDGCAICNNCDKALPSWYARDGEPLCDGCLEEITLAAVWN